MQENMEDEAIFPNRVLLKKIMMLFQIKKFSTYSNINFLSRTASFRGYMKWARKSLHVRITESPVWKNVSTANARCAPVQGMIITDCNWKEMIRHSLDGTIIATCLNLLTTYRSSLKCWAYFAVPCMNIIKKINFKSLIFHLNVVFFLFFLYLFIHFFFLCVCVILLLLPLNFINCYFSRGEITHLEIGWFKASAL